MQKKAFENYLEAPKMQKTACFVREDPCQAQGPAELNSRMVLSKHKI